MGLELSWLLLGAPLVFALGWMAARLDWRQLQRERSETPKAYFKGLSLLLNEQQDKAIDAFIEAVQHDPDTAELHFALGNLFRRRGEVERAVRVHQHLLARADLKAEDRDRAQRALAQDFLRAGLFDRAEEAWRKLEGSSFDGEARQALMALHERARDWPAALAVAQELQQRGDNSLGPRMAHYHCEMALLADARGEHAAAETALQQASEAAPSLARPWVQRAERHARRGEFTQALAAYTTLWQQQPAALGRVAADMVRCAQAAGQTDAAQELLDKAYQQRPGVALLKARLSLAAASGHDGTGDSHAVSAWVDHGRQAPVLAVAQALLEQPVQAWSADGLDTLRRAVDRAAKPVQRYRCAACGFEGQHWFWQCPGCLGWDTFPPQPIEEL
jgi:lipopolysaccharide biosynthesis regulator YciM